MEDQGPETAPLDTEDYLDTTAADCAGDTCPRTVAEQNVQAAPQSPTSLAADSAALEDIKGTDCEPVEESQIHVQSKPEEEAASPDTASATSEDSDHHDTDETSEDSRRSKKVNSVMTDLAALVGLKDIKKHFERIEQSFHICRLQGRNPTEERLHAVFQGNPGTGKTTVARMYARFLCSVGALESRTFVETSGAELASMGPVAVKGLFKSSRNFYSSSETSNSDSDYDSDDGPVARYRKSCCPSPGCLARGGVLFVDEAYQLTSTHSNGGQQALDILLTEMENKMGKLVVVFAGYKEELESFFGHNNPGLQSRIPHTLNFADFTEEELLRILVDIIKRKYHGQMKVEEGVDGRFVKVAIRRLAQSCGTRGFGNARAVENLLQRIEDRQKERLVMLTNLTKEDALYFTKEDLIGPRPSDVRSSSTAWAELSQLVGLKAVKKLVGTMFGNLEINYIREAEGKKPLTFTLNQVFYGSPGTGKTTVAKLFGRILADLGLLSNGSVVVKNPPDFIGEAVGRTEANTKAILRSTLGKVLIIDEAYMLDPGRGSSGHDSYRGSVLDTIVAEVQGSAGEDRCVIMLGYEDKMREMFRNANPGLCGRFSADEPFIFEDFDDAQIRKILDQKLIQQDLNATPEGLGAAMGVLSRARMRQNFSNGREVDNLLSRAKLNHLGQRSENDTPVCYIDVVLGPADFDPDFKRRRDAPRSCRSTVDIFITNDVIDQLESYRIPDSGDYVQGNDLAVQISWNFVFKGPSGTGKITAAKYMANLFYDGGLLPMRDVIECSVAEFIGQHVGHTAPKTKAQFERGLGRVLLIDDAHRLAETGYAAEAIQEFVYLLDKNPKRMVVILAGPAQEMDKLMKDNPKLAGIFDEEVIFQNFQPAHCVFLLERNLKYNKIVSGIFEDDVMKQKLERAFLALSKFPCWTNTRDIQHLVRSMHRRAADQKPSVTTGERTLSPDAVISCMAKMFKVKFNRNSSGTHSKTPPFCAEPGRPVGNAVSNGPKQELKAKASVAATVREVTVDTAVAKDEDKETHQGQKRVKKKTEQQALQEMGRCEAGFEWDKVEGGYKCKGGSHRVSDAEVRAWLGAGS